MTEHPELLRLPPRLRIKATMAYFGISRSTIYRRKRAGLLTIYKSGNISTVRTSEMVALFVPPTVSPAE
ncbi:MAG: helix-turn-helix domain-containing protein [Rhodobacteraceae bacterium]|nr:helix-turn-helix domain-containing protein [Paracoccaceae bacterium]